MTVPYLIAKVQRKGSALYLKREIIWYQKGKSSKIFQVKMLSKDIIKKIVP